MDDFSRFFLFVVLALAVLVMVGNKTRPTASTPLDGSTPVDQSLDADDAGLITRGAGFANVPSNGAVPPLSLMMPLAGVQPLGNA